jgi:hypothetical protein
MTAGVNFNLPTVSVEIKIHTIAVTSKLFGNWANDCLPWGEEEWPLTSGVLNKNSHESLNRSKNSSVDHDWSFVTWLARLLEPSEIFSGEVVGFEKL